MTLPAATTPAVDALQSPPLQTMHIGGVLHLQGRTNEAFASRR